MQNRPEECTVCSRGLSEQGGGAAQEVTAAVDVLGPSCFCGMGTLRPGVAGTCLGSQCGWQDRPSREPSAVFSMLLCHVSHAPPHPLASGRQRKAGGQALDSGVRDPDPTSGAAWLHGGTLGCHCLPLGLRLLSFKDLPSPCKLSSVHIQGSGPLIQVLKLRSHWGPARWRA